MSKKRVVVVTGGGSGMGRAIARRFADNGDIVYVLGRRSEKLKETAQGYDNILTVVADVTSVESLKKAKSTILSAHKNIDVLVNNAGGSASAAMEGGLEEALTAWQKVVNTNLTGVFAVIFNFYEHIARPGGRVITITSAAAFAGSSMEGVGGQAYAASKAGLHGLTRTLARMLAPEGVTVNCVAPGVIGDTEFFTPEGISEDRKQKYLPSIPVNRLGTADEVAEGVFYLASDEAGFITAEILNINGGSQFGR